MISGFSLCTVYIQAASIQLALSGLNFHNVADHKIKKSQLAKNFGELLMICQSAFTAKVFFCTVLDGL